ncbi:ribonuclease H2, subunit C [Copromyces sp. CBS 386.78]|nr:ribonuclease H2, subunit C [Copromyces sp. CBS 386.78]
MSRPIFAFTNTSTPLPKTTPNLLPCRIHHDGSVEPTDSFWNPREEDGLKTSYFRGRKLHGKSLPLPPGYKGVIASKAPKHGQSKQQQQQQNQNQQQQQQQPRRLAHEMSFVMENDNEPEVMDLEAAESENGQGSEPEVGGQMQMQMQMQIQAEFEEFVVWGHESLADAAGDAYVRGVEEWIGFAERVHSF